MISKGIVININGNNGNKWGECVNIMEKYKKKLIEVIYILTGTILMAIGVSLFLLPNQLSSGGFTGIATITYYLFNWQMGIVIFLMNVPLFLLALFKLGRGYFFKGLIGTASLSFFIDYFEKFNGFTHDRFLACIYGGIIIGVGTALVLKEEGSTGGTDMLANLIRHYVPKLKTGNIIVILDIIIVASNVFLFKETEIALYSAIAIYLNGKMIDIIFEGVNFTKVMFIISPKYKEIAKQVSERIKRGSTAIYAKGMYTREKKMILFCVGARGEIYRIKQIAKEIDKNAFIVIANARETVGLGFKKE